MKHASRGAVILSLVCGAAAAAEYTPSELQSMIAAGKTPDTLTPTTDIKDANFPVCRAMVNATIGALSHPVVYPVVVVADNPSTYAKKLWLNDAVMVFTCTSADGKFTTTTAKYK